MKTYDMAELAVRNLRESILRNSLTTVGISVGVASLVAMLSLGIGLQQLAGRRLQKSGLFDTVVVTSRRDLRGFNREQEENGPAPAESPALNESAATDCSTPQRGRGLSRHPLHHRTSLSRQAVLDDDGGSSFLGQEQRRFRWHAG